MKDSSSRPQLKGRTFLLPQGVRSVVALGSNLGYRKKTLWSALSYLSAHPGITLHKISPAVLSEPIGVSHDGTCVDVSGHPLYLNMVAELEVALDAVQLLRATQKIEDKHGRSREHRWSCRTLDIDIITYGNTRTETDDLVLPHPRAWERAFVLYPWALMDPSARLGPDPVRDLASRAYGRNSLRILPENFTDTFAKAPAFSSSSIGGAYGT